MWLDPRLLLWAVAVALDRKGTNARPHRLPLGCYPSLKYLLVKIERTS